MALRFSLKNDIIVSGSLTAISEKETIMSFESLSHSKWDCKYHVVFVPKYRKRKIYGEIRAFLGRTFHELARQRGCERIEGHAIQDHIHMMIKIPPKYLVAEVIGYIKGKSAIARKFGGRKRNFNGEKFWARGYAVSTVGFNEKQILKYVKNQKQLDGEGSEETGEF